MPPAAANQNACPVCVRRPLRSWKHITCPNKCCPDDSCAGAFQQLLRIGYIVAMRITLLLSGMFVVLAMGASGCVQDGSRQQVADDLSKSESQVFADQAVWMGDEGGYHYVRVRSIYSYTGDTDYRIVVKDWALADPFPLTDNTSQW